jgi:hypothetical protein
VPEIKPSLSERINQARSTREVIDTRLETSGRVIARVTDGIYRQPGSALRELISNAYDADASKVIIDTDAPRFEKISVSDDGHGMTPEVLAHLLQNIGGSAKRTLDATRLGISSQYDASLSPTGRRLIGKIGIGLFSVAQLTHTFQILTKVAGDSFRTVATVVLRTYSEDDLKGTTSDDKFESGLVRIWSERAEDINAHGTTIVLTGIRAETKDTLRSRRLWASIEESAKENAKGKPDFDPPKFHIGQVQPRDGELIKDSAQLPWSVDDSPEQKFRKLVDCVWAEIGHSTPNPKLEDLFDYYLRMIWNLGLGAPIRYVDGDPFDKQFEAEISAFEISNATKKAVAEPRDLPAGKTLRSMFEVENASNESTGFEVFVDGVQLARPLKFSGLPETSHALRGPLFFVGKYRHEFKEVDREISGGVLAFSAYLMWTPKVAPREHRGVLVRINGASGTLFDETFMRYQVSELTRLSQISCEIFVQEGLDGALNIDRESFNFAHPHYVFLSRWLHRALRQLASAQKRLASEVRDKRKEKATIAAVSKVREVVEDEWRELTRDSGESPPVVEFAGRDIAAGSASPTFVFEKQVVLSLPESGQTQDTPASRIVEAKVRAIAELLASYGLLDGLSQAKRESLLRAIARVVAMEDVN